MHEVKPPDLTEYGRGADGQRIGVDARLFMQLLAFGNCQDSQCLTTALAEAKVPAVLYADINDPAGVALLTFSPDPSFFVEELRTFLGASPFAELTQKPALTMLGRSYTQGYEPNPEDWLLARPRRTVCNPQWPWAIWYPLRRSGAFNQLESGEQRRILMEHGQIGRSFGAGDFARDVRLACHGLDSNDNDFVIGLVGKSLHPLSAVVEAMRKTVQTSQYLSSLGPFFVGKAIWQAETP